MNFKFVGLREFKKKYLEICCQIYSKETLEKSVFNRASFLNIFQIFLTGGKFHFLLNQNSTISILIKKDVAYLGYLESIDEQGYTKILALALEICKNQMVKEIFCPVDISLWHSHRYRLKNFTNSFPVIYNEPLGQEFYKKILEGFGFKICSKYVTAESSNFPAYHEITKNKLAIKDLKDYNVDKINLKSLFNLKEFIQIYLLSRTLFLKTKGFFGINILSFLLMYLSPTEFTPEKKFLYGLYHKKKLVGFIYFYLENINGVKSLTLKTLIVSRKFQNHGGYWLLNNIFYKKAKELKCEKVLYAYIKTDIEAYGLIPKDANIDREYGLFSK